MTLHSSPGYKHNYYEEFNIHHHLRQHLHHHLHNTQHNYEAFTQKPNNYFSSKIYAFRHFVLSIFLFLLLSQQTSCLVQHDVLSIPSAEFFNNNHFNSGFNNVSNKKSINNKNNIINTDNKINKYNSIKNDGNTQKTVRNITKKSTNIKPYMHTSTSQPNSSALSLNLSYQASFTISHDPSSSSSSSSSSSFSSSLSPLTTTSSSFVLSENRHLLVIIILSMLVLSAIFFTIFQLMVRVEAHTKSWNEVNHHHHTIFSDREDEDLELNDLRWCVQCSLLYMNMNRVW